MPVECHGWKVCALGGARLRAATEMCWWACGRSRRHSHRSRDCRRFAEFAEGEGDVGAAPPGDITAFQFQNIACIRVECWRKG